VTAPPELAADPDRTILRIAWLGLIAAAAGVALTLLDDDHLGQVDGPQWRALHDMLSAAAYILVGWALGARWRGDQR
jgi:hypothetical protein